MDIELSDNYEIVLWFRETKWKSCDFHDIPDTHPFNSQKAAPTVSAARSHQSGAVDLNSNLTTNPKYIYCLSGRTTGMGCRPILWAASEWTWHSLWNIVWHHQAAVRSTVSSEVNFRQWNNCKSVNRKIIFGLSSSARGTKQRAHCVCTSAATESSCPTMSCPRLIQKGNWV